MGETTQTLWSSIKWGSSCSDEFSGLIILELTLEGISSISIFLIRHNKLARYSSKKIVPNKKIFIENTGGITESENHIFFQK